MLRIAIAQINCTVGDLQGNSRLILEYIERSKGWGVDIIVFPELTLAGYPPEDLLLKQKFVQDNLTSLKKLAKQVKDPVAVVGFVDRKGKEIFNAAAIIYDRKIQGVYHKILLPNYGVFDEKRYFAAGENASVFKWGKLVFGVNICEDIWHKQSPIAQQVKAGAELILNINASVYHAGKIAEREAVVSAQARAHKVKIVYANLVGGQDELIFDGSSMIVDERGQIINRLEAFKEDLLIADLETQYSTAALRAPVPKKKEEHLEPVEEVYRALELGIRDYITKNGFNKVVIGLSGGIDSSLVATLAADALGSDNVIGVFMPSRYTCSDSEEDARQLATNLGIKFMKISIEQLYKMYLMILEPHFLGSGKNITEENLQARIRGNILMALSNKFGWLVLATGNKSEMSCGYATLYGDMAGGFAVIKDVPKVLVYKLAHFRNAVSWVIPERVLTKEPTAELKLNQKDRDSLPPYETLDPILKSYVEEDKDSASIIAQGFDKEVVQKVLSLVDKSEYKRRQAPPGVKITPKAFGRDRRMPITNKYKET